MSKITLGDYVVWKWAGSVAHGRVVEVVASRKEIISKGKIIVRNGSNINPAVVIEQDNGTTVLKLSSELKKANSES